MENIRMSNYWKRMSNESLAKRLELIDTKLVNEVSVDQLEVVVLLKTTILLQTQVIVELREMNQPFWARWANWWRRR
jgi:hypothetical protein